MSMHSISSMCRTGWSISLQQSSRNLATAALSLDIGTPCFDPSEAATLGSMLAVPQNDLRTTFPCISSPEAGSLRRSLQLTRSTSSDDLVSRKYHRPQHAHSHSSSASLPKYYPKSTSPQARKAVDRLLQRRVVDFTPVADGCGGVYFVTGSDGETMSVFKPTDEEVNNENNPKGYTADIDAGSRHFGAPREVAAYLLDQNYAGFSGVPVTAMVSVSNNKGQSKWGSLQEFVSHEDSAENFGGSDIPVDEVHKIGVLDIRLVNQDRHFANILCRRGDDGKLQLTPIDHGEVLPSCLKLDKARFEWMYWKQAKEPFSEETLRHIASLDTEKDAEFLRSLEHVDEECITTMVLATKLLQQGARQGLSLWDIGNVIQRDLFEDNERSQLEQAVFDILGPSPTKEGILEASDDIVVEVVSHALAGVDYLKRKAAKQ